MSPTVTEFGVIPGALAVFEEAFDPEAVVELDEPDAFLPELPQPATTRSSATPTPRSVRRDLHCLIVRFHNITSLPLPVCGHKRPLDGTAYV